jgi:hypothetical protein
VSSRWQISLKSKLRGSCVTHLAVLSESPNRGVWFAYKSASHYAGILGENTAYEEQREETVSVARREIRTGLDALFPPDFVAVIGATERTGTVGRTVLANLLHPSFRGKVLAVNSRHSEICGLKAYPTVADIPEKVDLAVVAMSAFRLAYTGIRVKG